MTSAIERLAAELANLSADEWARLAELRSAGREPDAVTPLSTGEALADAPASDHQAHGEARPGGESPGLTKCQANTASGSA